MKIKELTIVVFDNGGKTADRYTIIFEDGETYAASSEPFAPYGIGMYTGNIGDDYFRKTIGSNWDNGHSKRQVNRMIEDQTDSQINLARTCPQWLGEEVKDHSTLPENVIKYINQIKSS